MKTPLKTLNTLNYSMLRRFSSRADILGAAVAGWLNSGAGVLETAAGSRSLEEEILRD